MTDNKELAKYLNECMKTGEEVNTTFHLIKVPTEDELAFWIQQYNTRGCIGHSEWNETLKRNIWVKDEET